MFFSGFDQLGDRLERPGPDDPLESRSTSRSDTAPSSSSTLRSPLVFSRPFASFDPEESAAGARVRKRIVGAVQRAIDAGRLAADPVDSAHAYAWR